ncbi:hypothetical protein AK88_02854 [Plasmodium fragile]|uniref:Uncharacterized protein n=1 Tax=Plasmodium fragile TaxID=5857 RepID=A0A0D9QKG2_PLAFR|nr:uncharacterized protein AK88_02854 [Plasmodium fragile]KJP87550.1 hypothetical protein AK88_02854 [Plasmodium fragile]
MRRLLTVELDMQAPKQTKVLAKPGKGTPKKTASAGKSVSSDPKVESEGLSTSPKNEEQGAKADKKSEEPSGNGETDVQTPEQSHKLPVNPSGDSCPETKVPTEKYESSDPKVPSEGSLAPSPQNKEHSKKKTEKPKEPQVNGETNKQTPEQSISPVSPIGAFFKNTALGKIFKEQNPAVESDGPLPASQNKEQGVKATKKPAGRSSTTKHISTTNKRWVGFGVSNSAFNTAVGCLYFVPVLKDLWIIIFISAASGSIVVVLLILLYLCIRGKKWSRKSNKKLTPRTPPKTNKNPNVPKKSEAHGKPTVPNKP